MPGRSPLHGVVLGVPLGAMIWIAALKIVGAL